MAEIIQERETGAPWCDEPVELAGTGEFAVPVVGTSHYQSALETISRGGTGGAARGLFGAVLTPEPENPFDRHAIRIDIHGRTVGYLARPAAKAFGRALRGIGLADRPTTCAARVIGGPERGEGDGGRFGVRLDFAWPLHPL